jgi:hypothetical protein
MWASSREKHGSFYVPSDVIPCCTLLGDRQCQGDRAKTAVRLAAAHNVLQGQAEQSEKTVAEQDMAAESCFRRRVLWRIEIFR